MKEDSSTTTVSDLLKWAAVQMITKCRPSVVGYLLTRPSTKISHFEHPSQLHGLLLIYAIIDSIYIAK